MINRWRETISYKGSLRLGSPATETFQINSDKWWTPFWNGLSASDKSNMNFIAVHAYQHYYNNKETALQYLHAIDEIYANIGNPAGYNAKTYSTAYTTTISGSVTKLQNNKRYYARVRAYKVINGKKYYCKWSSVVTAKTKKVKVKKAKKTKKSKKTSKKK